MKFREFLVIAMVSLGTAIIVFDMLSGAPKIGAGSSPSVRHTLPAQLSLLASPSSPPVQPESLAGSKTKQGAKTQSTKSKNVAPEKSGAPQKWIPVEISVYSARYHGGRTASGERYDHYGGSKSGPTFHTAATTIRGKKWALPKNSVWLVEYKGAQLTVRINDVGSYRPKKADYWLDLSGHTWDHLTKGAKPSRVVGRMRRVK